MKVLIACEFSGAVRDAFRYKGHDAWSCDLLEGEGEFKQFHYQANVLGLLRKHKFDLMIAHPPCTYLTVTANKWLKDQAPRKSGALVGEARRQAREEAINFFMVFANSSISKIAIENPVGYMSSIYRKPDQIIQPMDFGHPEPKKTCLWLKNLPLLIPTHKGIEAEYHKTKSGKKLPRWYAYADKSKGQQHRALIRSKTFKGIAEAMAEQWGNL